MSPKPREPAPAPRRWSDEHGPGEAGELGRIFRGVPEPEPLSAAALSQVHARLGGRRRSASARRLRELLLAASMLLAGSSLAFAGWGVSEWWAARVERGAPAPNAANAPASAAPEQRRAMVAEAQGSHAELPASALVEPEASASAPTSPPIPSTSATTTTSALRSTERASAESRELDAESRALAGVLVKLRREHDPQAALALLDRSQALFERGALGLEAEVARIDALLAVGRRSEALALLEHLPFAQIGRGGELRLVRAELRASSDCAHALADFDALTRQALTPALTERVLYGRAACELQVGDQAQAEQDLEQYLRRFPHGRFAAQVASQLAHQARKPTE